MRCSERPSKTCLASCTQIEAIASEMEQPLKNVMLVASAHILASGLGREAGQQSAPHPLPAGAELGASSGKLSRSIYGIGCMAERSRRTSQFYPSGHSYIMASCAYHRTEFSVRGKALFLVFVSAFCNRGWKHVICWLLLRRAALLSFTT